MSAYGVYVSDSDQKSEESFWFIIKNLNSDVNRLEGKWDGFLEKTITLSNCVDNLADKVDHLTQVVTTGNGQKSVLHQLAEIKGEVTSVRDELGDVKKTNTLVMKDLEQIKGMTGILKSHKDLSKERWKSIGIIVAAIASVVPGIYAFVSQIVH